MTGTVRQYPGFGIVSLACLLFRMGTSLYRIAYPYQQAAAASSLGLLQYLISLIASTVPLSLSAPCPASSGARFKVASPQAPAGRGQALLMCSQVAMGLMRWADQASVAGACRWHAGRTQKVLALISIPLEENQEIQLARILVLAISPLQ